VTRTIDIVILSRTGGELHPDVERGIRDQRDVKLVVHRVVGARKATDRSRCDVISRARNEGSRCGTSPWLMFLDDDVVLSPRCVGTLLDELKRRPSYAALGADYLGERRAGRMAPHVSLGATLFRREALEQIRFVWRGGSCECQCCCDDLHRLRWAIDYSDAAHARHLARKNKRHGPPNRDGNAARVTCMCVTRGRTGLLRKSIQCFMNQTYVDRELVIVYGTDDLDTRLYVEGLQEPSILKVAVPKHSQLSLGTLRNIARQAGTGGFVALWDDDDWHHPRRLETQMRIVHETGRQGCALSRETLFDGTTKRAYISFNRPWENTILVERSILPTFPHRVRGEDTPVVEQLVREGRLAKLDAPQLYVYSYHGNNTWDRQHWEQIVRYGRPLGPSASRRIESLLGKAVDCEPQVSADSLNRSRHQADECIPGGSMSGAGSLCMYALTAGTLSRAYQESLDAVDY
jgi:Glycosyl transferase family 2